MEGTIISGKYQVLRPLGEGTYGTVYLVQHMDLGVQFALKLLKGKQAIPDSKLIDRFKREAEILLRFTHQGTVLFRDFGRTEDGVYYMVTDFCDGVSLEDIVARKEKFSVAQALEIMVQVLTTLEAAHLMQIIHRDIKSGNVMLERWGAAGKEPQLSTLRVEDVRTRILDFGIAKLQEDLQFEGSHMTLEGVSIGTPAYMSPEQASGEADLDHRVDIYACGVLLYELISGVVPFTGATVVQTLLKHLTQPPPPFNSALGVPESVSAIVMRALEKERSKRFQTARDFKLACARSAEHLVPSHDDGQSGTVVLSRSQFGLASGTTESVRISSVGARAAVESRAKVLCLDDNEMILQILRHLLEKEGYEVYTAANFSVIHDYIFRDQVNLMLCDVEMPGLPGNKICQLLKRVAPNLKIVLFSNIAERELEKLAAECKADGWLSKNSKPEEWINAVRSYTS